MTQLSFKAKYLIWKNRISDFHSQIDSIICSYNIIDFLFQKENMNFPHNFAFYGLECPGTTFTPYQNPNLINYQPYSYPQYFWADQNLPFQPTTPYLSYGLQPYLAPEMPLMDSQPIFFYKSTEQSNVIRIQPSKSQLHFSQLSDKYTENSQKQTKKARGALSFQDASQENQKLSLSTIEKPENNEKKYRTDFNNEEEFGDKRQIQNLRYQRKNIEANVVNKIYTYLKTCLKLGSRSGFNLVKNKDKASLYYKVLEKLEKAKKQNIKRQFLKGLITTQSSLPGYNKIAKQLLKKGQSLQQFEYYIRVIIKNYLRFGAINSILTSKKMNPLLWKDHIQKIRELEEYLFSVEQKQNLL